MLVRKHSQWGGHLFLTVVAVLVYLYQCFWFESGSVSGVFVPDVASVAQSLKNFGTGNGAFTVEVWDTFPGLTVLYGYVSNWLPFAGFLVNLLLLNWAIVLQRRLFGLVGIDTPLVSLGIVINPYLYLVACGPNKEIPITVLTLWLLYVCIKRSRFWLLASMLICAITYYIRDGYSIILLMLALLHALAPRSRLRFIALSACILVAVVIAYSYIGELVPAVARNTASVDNQDVLTLSQIQGFFGGELIAFVMRIVYNSVTLALFPQFRTLDGSWFILGCAYWWYGVLLLSAIGMCLYATVTQKRPGAQLAYSALVILCGVSVSLFVQPRYLMPIVPIGLGFLVGLMRPGLRIVTVVFVFVLMYVGVSQFAGRMPAPANIDDDPQDVPGYIIKEDYVGGRF